MLHYSITNNNGVLMNIGEILSLSNNANSLFVKRMMTHVSKGNNTTEIICRAGYCYFENHFDDGSIIEMAVIRDFNDNYKPTHIVLTEYTTDTNDGVKRYNMVYTERFGIDENK